MIILDEEDQQPKLDPSPVHGPTLRFPERAAGYSSNPLPDYETSQAHHHVIDKHSVQRRVDQRFWRATLYAMLIYVVLSIGIAIAVVKSIRSLRWRPPPVPIPWSDEVTINGTSGSRAAVTFGYPLMDENAICNPWQIADNHSVQGLYSATFDLDFPPNSDFTLRSNVSDQRNGPPLISGNLTVDVNPDGNATMAHIWVKIQTSSLDLRRRSYVCIQTSSNQADFSIFVPDDLQLSDKIQFDISVLYPPNPSPLQVGKLLTYLPMFGQKVGQLDQVINFNKVTLEGPTSAIAVGSLQAQKILVKSSYAEITGNFNASDSLILDTIGAPINTDITLFHDGRRKGSTFLSLSTGNSALNAQVTLLSPSVYSLLPNNLPNYMTQVKTFNGPLNLQVAHAPSTPSSAFNLRASNDLSSTNVILDSKYQGTFDVQTKLALAIVDEGSSTVDGQVRNYMYDHTSSDRKFGWVGYGQRPGKWHAMGQGHVEVVTSLCPVYLCLSRTES